MITMSKRNKRKLKFRNQIMKQKRKNRLKVPKLKLERKLIPKKNRKRK